MRARFRSWLRKIKQHPVVAILVFVGSVLGIALIVVLVLGYWLNWHWTGLVPETNEPKQHAKTLWDWLNLLGVLAIPAVVGLGAALYTAQQGKVSARENRDNQREAALQGYIDKMSELLLKEHLGCELTSKGELTPTEEEVRKIARVRTLTVLPRLDGERKRSVLQFLKESGLIDKDNRIVELHGADFWQADLRWIHLENAHLGGALCWKVDFSDAFLHGADLGGVRFREVTWNGADLSEADLSEAKFLDRAGNEDTTGIFIEELKKQAKSLVGATMPDGSKHP